MATKKILATAAVAAALGLGIGGAASSFADTTAPSATSGSSTQGGSGTDTARPAPHQHTAVTGSEAENVKKALAAKYSGVTVTKVEKDPDGSYDVHGTKSGNPVKYDISKDLKTIAERQGGPGGRGGHGRDGQGGPGTHQHTQVTGATLTNVKNAVTAKYSGVIIEKVLQDQDGSYDVLATKSGDRVMYEVSKDLKTITERQGGPHGDRKSPPNQQGQQGGSSTPSSTTSGAAA